MGVASCVGKVIEFDGRFGEDFGKEGDQKSC